MHRTHRETDLVTSGSITLPRVLTAGGSALRDLFVLVYQGLGELGMLLYSNRFARDDVHKMQTTINIMRWDTFHDST